MKSEILNLINEIESQIQIGTPGEYAHKKMMPEGRILTPEHNTKPTPSAVLIAIYNVSNELYFPLIRRPIYNGSHSGQMALPGGKYETSDKNLINTALREAYEEVGIKPETVKILGSLSQLFIPLTNMMVLPVLGFLTEAPEYKIDKHEVDKLFTIELKDLLTPSVKKIEKWNLKGNTIQVPYYYIQKQKVWGASAMILSEFEHILNQCNLSAVY